jgi:adenine-specific DNA-methyltransferase
MTSLLGEKGHVGVVAVDFKRYVGAQIGIHNPSGEKVGRVSHLRNKEYFFVVSERRDIVETVVRAIESSIAEAALVANAAKGKRKGHESQRRVE